MKIFRTLLVYIFLASTGVCSALVQDGAHLIKASDRSQIEHWIAELEQQTSAQVAIVTIETLGQIPLEEYAVNTFKKLGIGQKQKDNGILLLVASKEHQLRIEVGYGLEAVLTDALSNKIINNIIVPEFKKDHYSEGILKGIWDIISVVAKEAHIDITEPLQAEKPNIDPMGIGFGIFFFILYILFSKKMRLGGIGSHTFFGGGSGRGGGGFGGGSSGGGGASGRW